MDWVNLTGFQPFASWELGFGLDGALLAQARKPQPAMLSPETITHLAIWFAVLAGLVLVAVVVVRRFRDQSNDDGEGLGDMVTILRELKHEGDISDAEYRRLNAVLGSKLRQQPRGDEKTDSQV